MKKVYKKCIFDQKFWVKIPWSEVYKNCVSHSDQIQWSEMTKIFCHYCSLKMLCQIIKLHLEQSGTWVSCHFGQIVHFLIKALSDPRSPHCCGRLLWMTPKEKAYHVHILFFQCPWFPLEACRPINI